MVTETFSEYRKTQDGNKIKKSTTRICTTEQGKLLEHNNESYLRVEADSSMRCDKK